MAVFSLLSVISDQVFISFFAVYAKTMAPMPIATICIICNSFRHEYYTVVISTIAPSGCETTVRCTVHVLQIGWHSSSFILANLISRTGSHAS